MRCATSARLAVRRSSSSAWSFFSPSAETYWGLSRLFTDGLLTRSRAFGTRGLKRKALKAWWPSVLRALSMLRRQLYTDTLSRRPVRRRLLRWYSRAKRDLPWRHTHDP